MVASETGVVFMESEACKLEHSQCLPGEDGVRAAMRSAVAQARRERPARRARSRAWAGATIGCWCTPWRRPWAGVIRSPPPCRSSNCPPIRRSCWSAPPWPPRSPWASPSLGALLASLLLSRSISRIAGKTERIRNLDFSDRVPVESRITEIVRLSDSVERMREGLEVFGRYVSKNLVHQIMRSPETAGVGGTRREITVMFTDIEGFSLLSETMEPELLTSRLSRYFDALGSAISANHGMIDKYIGDSIMAFWNAPEPDPDHIANACRAALQAAAAGNQLSEKWRGRGRPGFRTRFGLHTGPAVVGNVGARERINYTLVGAVANQASRLEGLNKVYGTEILASGEVAGAHGRPLRVAPHRPHRGGRHDRAARHPRAVGRDRQRRRIMPSSWPSGEAGRAAYVEGRFEAALACFRAAAALGPTTGRAASSSSAARHSCAMARPRTGTASGTSTASDGSEAGRQPSAEEMRRAAHGVVAGIVEELVVGGGDDALGELEGVVGLDDVFRRRS